MAKSLKPDADVHEDGDGVLKVIGHRLREARLKGGLTQAQVASIIGTRQSYIGELEHGTTNMTIKTLVRMARFLGVDPRDLLPEGSSIVPTEGGMERLAAALDGVVKVLSERSAQDKELVVELMGFVGLRKSLELLVEIEKTKHVTGEVSGKRQPR